MTDRPIPNHDEFERRWKVTGELDDEARYLQQRLRIGTLKEERLCLAAKLGHEAALRVALAVNCPQAEDLHPVMPWPIRALKTVFRLSGLSKLAELTMEEEPREVKEREIKRIGAALWTFSEEAAVRSAVIALRCEVEGLGFGREEFEDPGFYEDLCCRMEAWLVQPCAARAADVLDRIRSFQPESFVWWADRAHRLNSRLYAGSTWSTALSAAATIAGVREGFAKESREPEEWQNTNWLQVTTLRADMRCGSRSVLEEIKTEISGWLLR